MQLGVNACIIQDGKILLTRREDFEVWCVPGGSLDPGETFPQACIREAYEETGLHVAVTRFIGVYSRVAWGDSSYHVLSFAVDVVGGELKPQVGEVIDIAYFAPDALPDNLLVGHRHRILDAFNGAGGSVVKHERPTWPFPSDYTRADLYAARDASGLGREPFYHKNFPPLTDDDIDIEIG